VLAPQGVVQLPATLAGQRAVCLVRVRALLQPAQRFHSFVDDGDVVIVAALGALHVLPGRARPGPADPEKVAGHVDGLPAQRDRRLPPHAGAREHLHDGAAVLPLASSASARAWDLHQGPDDDAAPSGAGAPDGAQLERRVDRENVGLQSTSLRPRDKDSTRPGDDRGEMNPRHERDGCATVFTGGVVRLLSG